MSSKHTDIKRNSEHYPDPTPYKTLKKEEIEDARFERFLRAMFNLCELAGYHIENRVIFSDLRTGRIYK